jgi:Replicative DNA helicase
MDTPEGKYSDARSKAQNPTITCSGIPSGLPSLDMITSGFQDSELTVICGQPSVGKTTLALTMAANIAIRERIGCAFFSLEIADTVLVQRLIASEAHISVDTIRSNILKPADFNSFLKASGSVYEATLYIVDMPSIKLSEFMTMARELKSSKDVKIIFIDYLTLISHEDVGLAQCDQIADIMRTLKALAQELHIPIVVVSQLKRMTEGQQPPTGLSALGVVEQTADLILLLSRDCNHCSPDAIPSSSVEADLIVAKPRHGLAERIKLDFKPAYARLDEQSKDSV